VITWTVFGTTALALGAVAWVVLPALRAGLESFQNWLTTTVGALAALAMVWEGFVPVFILPPCR
jgi:hypothetical protein